jgi:hypothetical protein
MRLRFSLLATAAALVAAVTAALAAPTAGAQTSPAAAPDAVSQQLVGTAGSQTYDLTATVTQLVNSAAGLQAVGTITGTVTDTVTGAVTTVDQVLNAPVTNVVEIANGSLVSLSLGATQVSALGQTIALQPIQVSADSGLLSGILGQLTGLLGGIGLGGGQSAPPPQSGGAATGILGLLNGLLGIL